MTLKGVQVEDDDADDTDATFVPCILFIWTGLCKALLEDDDIDGEKILECLSADILSEKLPF